jgi:hypothetical protein
MDDDLIVDWDVIYEGIAKVKKIAKGTETWTR